MSKTQAQPSTPATRSVSAMLMTMAGTAAERVRRTVISNVARGVLPADMAGTAEMRN